MKRKSTLAAALVVAVFTAAAQTPAPRVALETSAGKIVVELAPQAAPKTVENFLAYVKSGHYDGTVFHRVIPGFMIQGGDPITKDPNKKALYGQGGPGKSVKAEFNDMPHKRGIVSMARSQDPDSAGSQFFIVVEESPFLNSKYTVFGKIVKGLGVADKIVGQPRDEKDNPKDRIEMTVTVVE